MEMPPDGTGTKMGKTMTELETFCADMAFIAFMIAVALGIGMMVGFPVTWAFVLAFAGWATVFSVASVALAIINRRREPR